MLTQWGATLVIKIRERERERERERNKNKRERDRGVGAGRAGGARRGAHARDRRGAGVERAERARLRVGHIVAPPLQESSLALVRRDARPRHRALAATRCPEPRLCMLQPASERWSTRST